MIWTCTLTTMVQVSVDTILSLKVLAFARASGAGVIKKVKCYKKLNVETIYNAGNAGTIADINSGALYVFGLELRRLTMLTSLEVSEVVLLILKASQDHLKVRH